MSQSLSNRQPALYGRRMWQGPLFWSALALAMLTVSSVVVVLLNRTADAETRSSFGWATHTLEVEDQLHEALAALQEAESSERGYVLTGDTLYLAPSERATRRARQLLASLRTLTADNAAQQQRLDTLDRLVDLRLGRLQTGIGLMKVGQRDSVERLIRSGGGRTLMDSIRASVHRAVAHEQSLLQRRQRAVEHALANRRIDELLTVGIALLALVLGAAVWLRLRSAERVVTMCAWSKAIHLDGEWMSLEAYMERRFGISITHGISPAELERLEAEMDGAPALATFTAGVPLRGE